ncbi:MAG: peptide chain release factor N(5)-glutamine methyltransferase [Deltaproteobacteria bacterium]|nr:peptide chain release factor N(5)-glutamine methyltransferase [Deltaproteobacteria bacterium]
MKGNVITVREVLGLSTKYLEEHGSPSARLDTEVLTALALGIRRLDLYLAPERPLAATERESLRGFLRRRGKGEPVAYITGQREFFGLSFLVSPAVLIPRPETEVLVDATLEWLKRCGPSFHSVVDVGTGSGAIACAVAARNQSVRVAATDISHEALTVCRENVGRLGLEDRVRAVHCDLLGGLEPDGSLDVVVSNPPYVAEGDSVIMDQCVLDFEPRSALFAGEDGMSVTRRLVEQAGSHLAGGGVLLVEVGTPDQRDRVVGLLEDHGDFTEVRPLYDAARIVRGLEARRV